MDRYKINLHAHTEYSDGANTIEEFALASKEIGFSVAVITEHIYDVNWWPGIDYDKYVKQKKEAQLISKKLDYPIIVGSEFTIGEEECLVFGDQAISELLLRRQTRLDKDAETKDRRDSRGVLTIKDFKEIKKRYFSAMILCHPSLKEKDSQGNSTFISNGGVDFLDGFERYNSGRDMFHDDKPIPIEFKKLTEFSNSDAHRVNRIDTGYNIFSEYITTESALINYIKTKKTVELYFKN